MQNKEEYLQIIKKLENSVNVLLKGFYDLKKEINNSYKKKIDLSRQFSIINLPSKGIYYPNKNKSLLVRYLTAIEEHILCDTFLMESGRGIELVLSQLIMDNIDIKELLMCDFQAILMFLRSNAYGDIIEINPICPHCGKEGENEFKLSDLNFKKSEISPNENGKYVIFLPEIEKEFVISPLTLAKELEKIENESDNDYFIIKNEEGINTKIKKEKSLSLVYNIDSINEFSNKEQIKKIIRKLPKKQIDSIINFIKENELGIDEKVNLKCPFCGEEFIQRVDAGYNFLSLPDSYKNNIYEEIFLLTYYGKAITYTDAMVMPVVERKWHIRRIKEEIEKQNAAEKQAMNKAKANKGKFR
jgi:hypothetical protein